MTTGDGIFWAGLFYGVMRIIEQVFFYFVSHFPGKNTGRLERIEEALRENGIELRQAEDGKNHSTLPLRMEKQFKAGNYVQQDLPRALPGTV